MTQDEQIEDLRRRHLAGEISYGTYLQWVQQVRDGHTIPPRWTQLSLPDELMPKEAE